MTDHYFSIKNLSARWGTAFYYSIINCSQSERRDCFLNFHFSQRFTRHALKGESGPAHYIFDIDFPNQRGFFYSLSFYTSTIHSYARRVKEIYLSICLNILLL